MMQTLTLKIPDQAEAKEVKMIVAAMLFEKAVLSSGQAAELAGITRREFLETVGEYGVSVLGEEEDFDEVLELDI